MLMPAYNCQGRFEAAVASGVLTRDELRALAEPTIEALLDRRLNHQQFLVARLLVRLSFSHGLTVARVPEQLDIAKALSLDKSDAGDVLDELETMRILRRPREGEYELLPDPAGWLVQPRARNPRQEAEARQTRDALERLAAGPWQAEMLPAEPGLGDALAEVSREAAHQRERATSLPSRLASDSSTREDASTLPRAAVPASPREEALALRAQIAVSLRAAGWSEAEIAATERVPVAQLGQWANHPPPVGESPTVSGRITHRSQWVSRPLLHTRARARVMDMYMMTLLRRA